jgi:hypothetical protein
MKQSIRENAISDIREVGLSEIGFPKKVHP